MREDLDAVIDRQARVLAWAEQTGGRPFTADDVATALGLSLTHAGRAIGTLRRHGELRVVGGGFCYGSRAGSFEHSSGERGEHSPRPGETAGVDAEERAQLVEAHGAVGVIPGGLRPARPDDRRVGPPPPQHDAAVIEHEVSPEREGAPALAPAAAGGDPPARPVGSTTAEGREVARRGDGRRAIADAGGGAGGGGSQVRGRRGEPRGELAGDGGPGHAIDDADAVSCEGDDGAGAWEREGAHTPHAARRRPGCAGGRNGAGRRDSFGRRALRPRRRVPTGEPPESWRRVPHRRVIGVPWERYHDRLGAETDVAIAAEIGCTATAVHKARRRLGIEAYAPQTLRLGVVVQRFGRVLRSSIIEPLFDSHRSARRWLASRASARSSRLLALGATRDRRWIALPEGVEAREVEQLSPGLLGVFETALEAQHDRDVLVAGLGALGHDPGAVRSAGSAVLDHP